VDSFSTIPGRGVGSARTVAVPRKGEAMSVYKVIEIIGTSPTSWADAASVAVGQARETLRDIRVAEVVKQDLDVGEDGSLTYRTKLSVSFKYEGESN
jgi:flavin-binding protein dodecin